MATRCVGWNSQSLPAPPLGRLLKSTLKIPGIPYRIPQHSLTAITVQHSAQTIWAHSAEFYAMPLLDVFQLLCAENPVDPMEELYNFWVYSKVHWFI